MEKQQQHQTTNSSGICEKLFHAFHINSTFPTIRRLGFRQEESVATNEGPSLPSPPPNESVKRKTNKKSENVQPPVVASVTSESMPRKPTSRVKSAAATAAIEPASTAGQVKDMVAKNAEATNAKEEFNGAGKSKRNMNHKIDEYINRTKNKMMSVGRAPTSKA